MPENQFFIIKFFFFCFNNKNQQLQVNTIFSPDFAYTFQAELINAKNVKKNVFL